MRLLTMISLLALGAYASAGDHCINTTCPVSGKPVDKTVKTVPFNPKTDQTAKAAPGGVAAKGEIGFCCPKCEATYLKDPEKYRGDLEKQHSSKKD